MIEILPENITKDNLALKFGALGNGPSVRPQQENEENEGLVAWEVMGCTTKHDAGKVLEAGEGDMCLHGRGGTGPGMHRCVVCLWSLDKGQEVKLLVSSTSRDWRGRASIWLLPCECMHMKDTKLSSPLTGIAD